MSNALAHSSATRLCPNSNNNNTNNKSRRQATRQQPRMIRVHLCLLANPQPTRCIRAIPRWSPSFLPKDRIAPLAPAVTGLSMLPPDLFPRLVSETARLLPRPTSLLLLLLLLHSISRETPSSMLSLASRPLKRRGSKTTARRRSTGSDGVLISLSVNGCALSLFLCSTVRLARCIS